ncbi:hypothetical protein [Paenibacillus sp. N3.4]|uniref:hypothetical protein n=1 Tax=Paenibacillus sp. N3.4 TaxID=2603222 RepID=UPI0011C8322B|nr:hypothetical protein [Paenibacillus sp. N3.4]TXK71718.1 hypothetical protein FU659_32825 [Paenibacillus sp. N3.4]
MGLFIFCAVFETGTTVSDEGYPISINVEMIGSSLMIQHYLDFIRGQGTTFEEAARERQAASSDHNSRETPLFAESIGKPSITGGYYC